MSVFSGYFFTNRKFWLTDSSFVSALVKYKSSVIKLLQNDLRMSEEMLIGSKSYSPFYPTALHRDIHAMWERVECSRQEKPLYPHFQQYNSLQESSNTIISLRMKPIYQSYTRVFLSHNKHIHDWWQFIPQRVSILLIESKCWIHRALGKTIE